ncbi:ABC transporter ATP-binding protein [Candidatus Gottesmanbacteria bacterium]|nr:ABC transporter ATP-binding protein [Candidatus Gottesmanbacteria bacterium]MBI5452592.1 ABC transporter ATP-binding protein [Candidatus Gottesmanbacteria bacterium]
MITLKNVFKEYKLDGEIFAALKNINLSIKKGEFTAILGPSGSGKSTLMHLIGLLDIPTRGRIEVEGKDISKLSDETLSRLRNEFVGFVFQQFNLINKLTVIENILLPTVYASQKFGINFKDKAFNLMERFGIEEKASSYPNKLSGGQQQRVAIARALINNPKLILADEPTGNLDTKTGGKILSLLEELNADDKITVILVTHEKDVADYTRRKIQIRDGEIQ